MPGGRCIYAPECEPSKSQDTPSQHNCVDSTHMNNPVIERVRELQCEVAQIAAAHRVEMPYRKGDLEKLRYERRLDRLQEINEELSYLLLRAA